MVSAAGVLGAVVLVGAAAYYAVGEVRWSWFDCFYMTIITLSTVGFAETLEGMNEIPEVPQGVRAELRERLDAEGLPALRAELRKAGWLTTSFTRSPRSQISRSSARLARYSAPV